MPIKATKFSHQIKDTGLVYGDKPDICIICKKPTYTYDLDFNCPVHIKCQDKLIEDYITAEQIRKEFIDSDLPENRGD